MTYRVAFVWISFLLTVRLTPVNAQTPGATPELNPTGDAGALKGQIQTAGSYDAHSGNATRIVTDLHVPGALGVYGLDFTRYWNSTHNDYDNYHGANAVLDWPMDFGASGWSHSWRWNAAYDNIYPEEIRGTDTDTNQYTTAINITFPDGHITKYKIVRLGHGEWMVPGSYPDYFGPPYTQSEIQYNFPYGGTGVHDHLCNMAPDGSQFWLCRADGGSVHFLWDQNYGFLAKEVFDPHGFRTTLSYDDNGNLKWVEPEGGRFLKINWAPYGGVLLIKSVQSGPGQRDSAVTQTVRYEYGLNYALAEVYYEQEPLPGGGVVKAEYTYGTCWGGGTEPCPSSDGTGSLLPLLKRADDPHFAGPMTVIKYDYKGVGCPHLILNPLAHPDYVEAQPYAIVAEKSDTGIQVSRFELHCDGGLRKEYNGLGSSRTFYFGSSAETNNGGLFCRGFELGKLTDFARTYWVQPPFESQNFGVSGHPAEIWDARGIMTRAIYAGGDNSGEPAEIRRADGSVEYYNRVNPGASAPLDASRMHNAYNHWLFSQTDELNRTTIYTRDARRRVTRIDYPGGSAEEFVYNTFNQVTSHTLPSGAVVTLVYDGRGLLQSEYNSIDGWDARKEYVYYLPGELGGTPDLVKTVSDGRSRSAGKDFSTRMTYNGRHQVLTVEYAGMNNAPGNPTVRYGCDRYGNCTSITDELGHPSLYEYDGYRRCISYTEPLNAQDWEGGSTIASRRWDWIYDRWDGTTLHDASAHTSKQWRVQIEPEFNSARDRRLSARSFDANDRVIEEYSGLWQAADGSWHAGPDTEGHYFTYDENGQKKSYTDPQNRVTTYDYDLRNRLWKTNETVNTIPRTTETLYDFAGNKTRINFPVEAAGQRSQQWLDYDAFGQPWTFIDERNSTTNMTYQWGPMKKVHTVTTHRQKDGGGTEDQLTRFEYDPIGRPQWTFFPDNSNELTTYLFGQVDAFKTRKDQTKRIHYDARGREDYHTWDSDAAPGITRTWDAANRLLTLSNAVSTIDYGYDDAGQPTYEGNTITGSGSYTHINYLRYPDGAVSYMQYPNNVWVHHDYSARGQLKNVLEWAGAWQPSVSYYYHPDGKVEHQAYGNGVHTGFAYDGRGMTQVVHHQRAAPFQSYALRNYTRDERDRITAFQKGVSSYNPMENGKGDRFVYDAEGQLTDAWYNATDPAGNATGWDRKDHFAYDALGNRQGSNNNVASRNSGTTAVSFLRRDNGLNQYLSWSPSLIPYDDNYPGLGWPGNGVMVADDLVTANYNALNQPVAIWPANWGGARMWFGYDPLGRCVKRWTGSASASAPGTNPATYYYYNGWNLIEEGASPWSPARYYVHGARLDELATSHNMSTGQIAYHHFDARGHCNLLTNASGAILEQYEYDAFGFPRFFSSTAQPFNSSTFGNRFLFTGREYLSDLKLYDYRARLYQPELGRFLQPDPKEFAAGDYNLYRYCHNDPVNRNDPTGLDTDFGTVPQPILSLGIEAATQSLMLTRATGDGLERGIVGLQNRADPSKLSLAPPNVGVGIPYVGPQTTETGTPRLGLGEKTVIIGHDHPTESNLSSADKAAADHAKIPVVMTSDGKTFQVYVPHITPSGQVLNRDGVTEIVTKEGVHVFTQQSGKLTPTR